jgi:hypothetical protein
MRGARYVRLIPWTLRSGSEQEQLKNNKPSSGTSPDTGLHVHTIYSQTQSCETVPLEVNSSQFPLTCGYLYEQI